MAAQDVLSVFGLTAIQWLPPDILKPIANAY